MGAQVAQLLWNGESLPPASRKAQLGFLMFFIVITMLFSTSPYIDWSAHLGGLMLGFVVGSIVFGRRSVHERVRAIVPLVSFVTLIVYFVLGFALFYTVVHV
jgi:membrane associated rhomboid family serine protease